MKIEEYRALFETRVSWGEADDTARHITHDYIEKLAEIEKEEAND